MKHLVIALLLLLSVLSSAAQTVTNTATQILVLGTPHLREKGGMDPSATEPIRKVLERYKPEAIGVECIAPEVLGDMEQRGGFYLQVVEMFAGKYLKVGKEAQASLKKTRSQAQIDSEKELRALHAPTPEIRRSLAANLLAAYNFESALLQWSYLPAFERHAGDGITVQLVKDLDTGLESRGEDAVIAIPLARTLGLQQLYQIDDQTDAIVFNRLDEAFPGELEKIQKNPETVASQGATIYKRSSELLDEGKHDGVALVREYEWVNSSEYSQQDVNLQWGRYLRMHLPSGVDRARLAQWETRNLLIASHVREASAMYPGKRVLVLIGAAHKPFLDKYLGEMMDVKLVQLTDILPVTPIH